MVTSDTALAIAYNLAQRLTSIQNVFLFNVHRHSLAVPGGGGSTMPAETLEAIALEVGRKLDPPEIPLLITMQDIDDGSFSSFDDTVAVISLKHWNKPDFSPWPVERFLLYTIADFLMNIYVDTPVHEKPKKCIGDRCEDEQEINDSLAVCEYCSHCRRIISAALQRGRISPRESAAIYRILDFAAERRRVFVLMPFAKGFDAIYTTIKDVSVQCGWHCSRADDIQHTRDIISVIWEEIERCECVIADLTGENANVFYELGYAHAAGKNTILLTQNLATLPFDLKHRIVIKYRSTIAGRQAMAEALMSHLDA
jgi:hypothetical protein